MLTRTLALDVVADGLVNLGLATQDKQLVEASRYAYERVAEIFCQKLKTDEKCLLAFPSFLIRPDMRVDCFVTIQPTRIVVGWKQGFFRKRAESLLINPPDVTDVTYGPGSGPLRNAYLLTIEEREKTVLALPVDQPRLGGQLKDVILTAGRGIHNDADG
jgi:hypothetical protein